MHSGVRLILRASLVVVALATACGPTTIPASPSAQPSPAPSVPSATATPLPTPSLPSRPPAPVRRSLRIGERGSDVLRTQERLNALGYWLGRPDGVFETTTQQAVFALQKAAGLTRDGIVGPHTRRALRHGAIPTAHSTSGHVIEIDLARDLLLIVDDGRVSSVLNTSTGGGYVYVSHGVTEIAHTPVGQFRVYRQIDGLEISPLGEMWRPKYFVGGYAIHGSASVPPLPASHGCVRLTNAAMDWIWAAGLMPLGTAVWIYG